MPPHNLVAILGKVVYGGGERRGCNVITTLGEEDGLFRWEYGEQFPAGVMCQLGQNTVSFDKLDGIALLIKDHSLQMHPFFLNPPLFIVITFEPMM